MKKLLARLLNQTHLEARAGAALSWASVHFPDLVGSRYMGVPNEYGELENEYPLTPLRWRLARSIGSAPARAAVYEGDANAGIKIKDAKLAGLSSIALQHLRPHPGESVLAVPAVGWIYKDQELLVAPIPEDDIAGLSGDTFTFAMRIGREPLHAVAGLWLPREGELWTRGDVTAGERVSITEVPEDVPAY